MPDASLTADQWAARARDLNSRGVLFEALESFDHAVSVDPSRSDIRLEYAGLLKTAGYWLRGAEQYKVILEKEPDQVAALLGYGELLNAEYQFGAAVATFSRVLGLNPPAEDRERAGRGLGSAQFGLEDYRAAAKTFEGILAERPDAASALAYLALAHQRMGDLEDALVLWNRYLDLLPNVNRAKLHRSRVEQLVAGIGQTRNAVQKNPEDPRLWAKLGRLLLQKPDLPGAGEAFAAAAKIEPDNPLYRLKLGVVMRDMQRWNEAAASFSSLGNDYQHGALALYNLAYCARRAADHEAEARAWTRMLERNPQDLFAYRRFVRSLGATNGLDLEKSRVDRLIAVTASSSDVDPMPFMRLAIVQEARGDKEAAIRAALEAVAADLNDVRARSLMRAMLDYDERLIRDMLSSLESPGEPSGELKRLRTRGALLLSVGRPEEAEIEFRRSLENEPDDARTLVGLAASLKSSGREAEALRVLEAVRKDHTEYLYGHLGAGFAYMKLHQWPQALEAGIRAVELAPHNPLGYSVLGASYNATGDLPKAAHALERAISLDPMDEVGAPRLLLAKVYGAMNDNEKALETLKGDLPESPGEIYEKAWQFVWDTYHDRSFNSQNWKAWRDRFEGRLNTASEALSAVALMLASLDDRSTRLRSHEQTASLLFTDRTTGAEYSEAGTALSTSKTVEARHLKDNVGYIAITNLHDPRLPEQLEEAAKKMKDSEGVILDLRGNEGGADSDVEKLSGMFVTPGTETGKIITSGGSTIVKAEAADGTGGAIIDEDKPVVVLVDRNTASSAENLAASLKESNRAILVGERTKGKASIQVPKLLPGGAILLVVGAERADLQGNLYTGIGLEPDVSIEEPGRGDRTEGDPAIREARELIRKPRQRR